MAHLSRWLAAEGLDESALTVPTVERYFADRRSAGYANERTVAALGPLLGYLRGLGAAPVAVSESPATVAGQLLARYACHLATEPAGTTAGTLNSQDPGHPRHQPSMTKTDITPLKGL